MHSIDTEANPHETNAPAASGRLVAAALSGLLGIGLATACNNDVKANADSRSATGGEGGADAGSPASGGTPGSGGTADSGATPAGGGGDVATDGGGAIDSGLYNYILIEDAGGMTMDGFQKLCDERGGFVYRTASCAGGSACKGLEWFFGQVFAHSCRGQNSSCFGIHCLDMPKDTGLQGEDIYDNGPCPSCHQYDGSGTHNPKVYTVNYNPYDMTAAEAVKRFKGLSDEVLEASMVFGVQGFDMDGVPYVNMPSYRDRYSVAEIKRVVAYLKKRELVTYGKMLFGITPGYGISPEAGVPLPFTGDGGVPPPKDGGGD